MSQIPDLQRANPLAAGLSPSQAVPPSIRYVYAPTREDRLNRALLPALWQHEGSVLAVTVGPQAAHKSMAVRRMLHGQSVHLFDPYGLTGQAGASIDLLDFLEPRAPEFGAQVRNLADSLLQTHKETLAARSALLSRARTITSQLHMTPPEKKARWVAEGSSELLEAMIAYVKLAPEGALPRKERTLAHIARQFGLFEENWAAFLGAMQAYRGPMEEKIVPAARTYRYTWDNETRLAVKHTVSQALSMLREPKVLASVQPSSFDVRRAMKGQDNLYIVLPDDPVKIEAAAPWVRGFVRLSSLLCEPKDKKARLLVMDDAHKIGATHWARSGGPLLAAVPHAQDVPRARAAGADIADLRAQSPTTPPPALRLQ